MLKFGDTFKYKEKDYVYLAHSEEILYSALILDFEMSEKVKKRIDYLCKIKSTPEMDEIMSRRAYCFVELRTEDVKNRLAHFANTGEEISDYSSLLSVGKLNNDDLREIKKEIEVGPVPLMLKDLVKDITIEES
jgi:hypothetical protein